MLNKTVISLSIFIKTHFIGTGRIPYPYQRHVPTELTCLDLSFKYFNGAEIRDLAGVIEKLSHLSELILNGIGWEFDTEMHILAPSIKKCTQLTVLQFAFNQMRTEGMSHLATAIEGLPQLSKLNLSFNPIRDVGVMTLVNTIKRCTKLSTLLLEEIGMTCKGIRSLESVLGDFSELSIINLDYNNIGSDGVTILAPCITRLKNLSKLSLRGCQIDDIGAEALAASLSKLQECVKEGNLVTWRPSIALDVLDNPLGTSFLETLHCVTRELVPWFRPAWTLIDS